MSSAEPAIGTTRGDSPPAEPIAAPGAVPRAWAASPARSWTFGCLLVTAAVVPLVFVPGFRDAFALPKLALLYLLVPAALAGPMVHLVVSAALPRPRIRLPDVAGITFAVLAVAATLASPAPIHALQGEPLQYQGLLPLLLYVACYALARITIAGSGSGVRFFAAAALSGGLVAAYALVQLAGLDPIWPGLDRGRAFSTLGQAGNLGAYVVIALPLAAAAVLAGSRQVRIVAALAVALMFVALLASLSRGAYLGLAAELVVGALFVVPAVRRRAIGRRAIAAGAAVLAVVALLVLAVPQTRQVAGQAWQRGTSAVAGTDTSITERVDLWAAGTRIALDHPLLGAGPDSFALEFPRYRDTTLPAERAAVLARFRPESPHDVYLAIADGLGLPALAAYLVLVAAAVWRSVRVVGRGSASERVVAAAIVAAISGHLVTDAFMTGELAGSTVFWLCLGIAVSLPAARPGAHRGVGRRDVTQAGLQWGARRVPRKQLLKRPSQPPRLS